MSESSRRQRFSSDSSSATYSSSYEKKESSLSSVDGVPPTSEEEEGTAGKPSMLQAMGERLMTETGDIALRSAVGTVTRATVGNIPRFNSHFSVIRNRFVSMRMKPLIRLSFRDLQLFLCCHIHICNILASGFVFFSYRFRAAL